MLVCNEAQKGASRCEKAADEVLWYPWQISGGRADLVRSGDGIFSGG